MQTNATTSGIAAVVEDDASLSQQLQDILSLAGWRTQRFSRGQDFLLRQQRAAFDIALIDMRLPDLNGIQLLERLGQSAPGSEGTRTARLVVTGLMDEEKLERAFALGADDYVLKPFRARELLARVGAAHRRRQPNSGLRAGVCPEGATPYSPHSPHSPLSPYTIGCFQISPGLRQISRGGQVVALTDKEFDAALLLFRRIGKTVTREEMGLEVWKAPVPPETRTIDTHVSRLRRKLELTTAQGFRLAPVYGVGYRLDLLPPQPGVST
ncbi:MAG: hypothetical protein RLZZ344_1439 [Pseudomonadota bacterium]|jgi:DNA-binding response OmpR family regulator